MFLEGFFVENLLGFCQAFFWSIWVVYASGCEVRQRLFGLVHDLNCLHSFCSKLWCLHQKSPTRGGDGPLGLGDCARSLKSC